MLHQTFLFLGQLWQLFEVSQILEFLRYILTCLKITILLPFLLESHVYCEIPLSRPPFGLPIRGPISKMVLILNIKS